jgi:hypothetical protein
MINRHFANVAIVACSFSATMVAGAVAEPRAVVELFTSQGCSSCPAADKLLGQLTADSSLVPISAPIDYWDYLGWKDTLAVPLHTKRQRAYSKVRGDREVYTPQAVINGSLHALGSDKAAIERAIAKSHEDSKVLSLPVTFSLQNAHLILTVPGRSEAPVGTEVWICGLTKAVTVAIQRGENRGKTVTYFNVARRWVKLDSWTGGAKTWNVPVRDVQGGDIDGFVAMIQSGTVEKPGAILGAAMASIR